MYSTAPQGMQQPQTIMAPVLIQQHPGGLFSSQRLPGMVAISFVIILLGALISVGTRDSATLEDEDPQVSLNEANSARTGTRVGLLVFVLGLTFQALFVGVGALQNGDIPMPVRVSMIAWTGLLLLITLWTIQTAGLVIESAKVSQNFG